jgi:predicted flap endonuclease-1-like 5' DNA nuclease
MELPRGIGQPATRALNGEGITSLEQAAAYTEAQLLALHGVGPKAIRVLREAFAEHKLDFA